MITYTNSLKTNGYLCMHGNIANTRYLIRINRNKYTLQEAKQHKLINILQLESTKMQVRLPKRFPFQGFLRHAINFVETL